MTEMYRGDLISSIEALVESAFELPHVLVSGDGATIRFASISEEEAESHNKLFELIGDDKRWVEVEK